MSKKLPIATKVLKLARRLLTTKGWTQGYFAKDDRGNEVCSDSKLAKCYCSLGGIRAARALLKVETADEGAGTYLLRSLATRDRKGLAGIVDWNDFPGRTKRQVLAKFDQAIKLSLAEAR